ncbi:MAG: hypothetical protein HYY06_08560 [Deltaproteobacteria bacterium]|nr:hypothetical protein [Deltaproteobacteria bacterium]
MRPFGVAALVAGLVALSSTHATADEPPPAPPPPYSLPWQLRPAAVATVVRSDTAVAFYEDAAGNGSTVATTLLGSYKLTPWLAPLVRLGFVSNAPGGDGSGVSLVNPVLGATGLWPLGSDLRLTGFLGFAIPVGMGGGNSPDADARSAAGSGILARSAMDNAMFAVNYFTVFPGIDLAFVKGGFTAQLEVTVLELLRVRGEEVDADEARTNFTAGLHLGYFVIPQVSLGAELRYQRWLSTPVFVEADSKKRDTLTLAVGPRFHIKLSDTMWIRPGVAYARGMDDPMSGQDYNVVQVDLPVSF